MEKLKAKIESLIVELRPLFPELDKVDITVKVKKKTDYLMAITSNPIKKNAILKIDWFLRKASEEALKGCLAHELIHIGDDIKNGVFGFIINAVKNRHFNASLERKVDLEVINRGLGNELLEFQKFHDKYFEKYNESDGLTKKEIKRILAEKN